jgi:hypothetical protein
MEAIVRNRESSTGDLWVKGHRDDCHAALIGSDCIKNGGEPAVRRRQHGRISDALVSFVGPFQLHGVLPNFFGFPGTDVADFTVGIVVPALAGNRIGNGFA